jgi:hypothetical protein
LLDRRARLATLVAAASAPALAADGVQSLDEELQRLREAHSGSNGLNLAMTRVDLDKDLGWWAQPIFPAIRPATRSGP